MALCFENFALTKETSNKLLEAVDRKIGEHFFSKCGLLKLGWWSYYHLDSRIARYPIQKSPHLGCIKKT